MSETEYRFRRIINASKNIPSIHQNFNIEKYIEKDHSKAKEDADLIRQENYTELVRRNSNGKR